jgi:hypothetical protein
MSFLMFWISRSFISCYYSKCLFKEASNSYFSRANSRLKESLSFSMSSIFSCNTSMCSLSCYSTFMWFLTSASYNCNCCSYSFGGNSMDLEVDDYGVYCCKFDWEVPEMLLAFLVSFLSSPYAPSFATLAVFSSSSFIYMRISIEVRM